MNKTIWSRVLDSGEIHLKRWIRWKKLLLRILLRMHIIKNIYFFLFFIFVKIITICFSWRLIITNTSFKDFREKQLSDSCLVTSGYWVKIIWKVFWDEGILRPEKCVTNLFTIQRLYKSTFLSESNQTRSS